MLVSLKNSDGVVLFEYMEEPLCEFHTCKACVKDAKKREVLDAERNG